MTLDTKFDSPGRKRKSELVKAGWAPSGANRVGYELTIAKNVQLFRYGLSIEEIREKLGYKRNSTVASFLRQGGVNVPRPSHDRFNSVNTEEFYRKIKIEDIEE